MVGARIEHPALDRHRDQSLQIDCGPREDTIPGELTCKAFHEHATHARDLRWQRFDWMALAERPLADLRLDEVTVLHSRLGRRGASDDTQRHHGCKRAAAQRKIVGRLRLHTGKDMKYTLQVERRHSARLDKYSCRGHL